MPSAWQLGGVAPALAAMIKDALGYKYHWAVADTSSAPLSVASATDVEQAYAVGKAAVEFALAGRTRCTHHRSWQQSRYRWSIGEAPLAKVANREKVAGELPAQDGFGITPAARRYLAPLIAGKRLPWVMGCQRSLA